MAYDIIKKLIPAYNERALTEDDFSFLADTNEIGVCELPLKKRGYHAWDAGIDCVFIRKTLKGLKWLETAFHELFHALLQVPCDFLHDRQQKEVVALCLIALIPLPMMENYLFLEENPTPHAKKLFREREKVYFLYGV